ncbi:MAG TPA: NUDIX hydrolase [Thermoanaerobaculia bacterium]|jgi:8-oxo-dGTP pyrophosphatase MutT (NUDIX family)
MKRELEASLAVYVAQGAQEAESLAWMQRFLARPEDPFSRATAEGHFTGSAVIARPDGSAYLLVLHRKLGRWLQPGGHTEEADASVFDTARREAREETGIARLEAPLGRAILDVDVHAIPAHGRDAAHAHFDVRYLFTTELDVDPEASEDPSRPMRWVSLDEASALGMDGSLARALFKARARLAPGAGSGPEHP